MAPQKLRPRMVVKVAFVAAVLLIGVAVAHAEVGIASNYCDRVTANGERMRCSAMTAAHRKLPFNTMVRVSTGRRSVVVRINDRGPFIRGRIIDVTPAAMRVLGCDGVCRVSLEIIGR